MDLRFRGVCAAMRRDGKRFPASCSQVTGNLSRNVAPNFVKVAAETVRSEERG